MLASPLQEAEALGAAARALRVAKELGAAARALRAEAFAAEQSVDCGSARADSVPVERSRDGYSAVPQAGDRYAPAIPFDDSFADGSLQVDYWAESAWRSSEGPRDDSCPGDCWADSWPDDYSADSELADSVALTPDDRS